MNNLRIIAISLIKVKFSNQMVRTDIWMKQKSLTSLYVPRVISKVTFKKDLREKDMLFLGVSVSALTGNFIQ